MNRRASVACLVLGASLLARAASSGSTRQLAPRQPGEWWLAGSDPKAYALDAKGKVTDTEGSDLALRCVDPSTTGFGNAATTVRADEYRERRITLAAEMQTAGAKGGAWLWLRVDAGMQTLLLQSGRDEPLRGDSAWTRRAVTVPVPADATSLSFGLALDAGGGSVTARAVRLEPGPPIVADGPIAPAAAKVLDAAITIVKKHALRADKVDWPKVEPEVRALAGGADRPSAVYPAIGVLLARLGDNHSFFMAASRTSEFRSGGASNPPAEVRQLAEGVGYVLVPAYGGMDQQAGKAYARRAHDAMAGVVASASCGWVVDLRTNTGGNMWPMLAGLKPLLGTGVLGAFEDREGKSQKWNADAEGDIKAKVPEALRRLEFAWVAVLTGPRTGSSGEFVAVAFRGRPRTRSFGLPTAGLSTSNETYPLPDGSMILLTTAVGVDRTGRRYGGRIEPDEVVQANAPLSSVGSADDRTLAAAVQWLKQSSGCVPQ